MCATVRAHRSSLRVRRRRRQVAAGALVVAGLVAGLLLLTGRPPSPVTTPASRHPPGSLRGHRGRTTRRPPSIRGDAVTMEQLTIVDTSRPLISDGQVLANEISLPTDVWLPSAPGRYPLVVFVHGYDVGPMTYERFCSTLASAGYLVAAPSFPLEDPSRGYGLNRDDLPNEPTDVSFVITTVEQGPLAARVVPGAVAVVGHSDGADVALMIGYQAGKVDPRVRAVVADAPDPMTGPIAASSVPLLLMQGNADTTVPYQSSQTVFAQVGAPRYYLTLLGANHFPPIGGSSPWTPTLDAAVADFLDATVAGRGPGTAALPAQLGALPLSSLQLGH